MIRQNKIIFILNDCLVLIVHVENCRNMHGKYHNVYCVLSFEHQVGLPLPIWVSNSYCLSVYYHY